MVETPPAFTTPLSVFVPVLLLDSMPMPFRLRLMPNLTPKTTLIDYSGLNFKEMLLACPIDGVDLTREPEYPREVEP